MPSVPGADSSYDKFDGMIATGLSCLIDGYSACAPNAPSQYPKTRSPTANDVTAEPTDSTLPANSLPSTAARGFRSPLNSLTMNGLANR
jgi:hypothetical protein